MPDDRTNGPQDRSRIDTNEVHELRYWSQKFGVTIDELKAAVRRAGNSVKAVAVDLRRSPAGNLRAWKKPPASGGRPEFPSTAPAFNDRT
jgi:hypothetical protein